MVMLTGVGAQPPWRDRRPRRQSWCWMASVSLCTTRSRADLGVSWGGESPRGLGEMP